MDGALRGQSKLVLGLALAGLVVAASSGCAALATAIYVVKGSNVEAQYVGLKGQRVAVVCRPAVSLEYTNTSVARELARRVAARLGENVRRIEIVDPAKVERWIDENTWDDFAEVGKGVEAETVVAVELEEFSLYSGQTVFQGKANYSLSVIDLATGELAFERTPPQSLYPPNTGVPTGDIQEPEFRRQFLTRLAEEIARHFYDHDAQADFAWNGITD